MTTATDELNQWLRNGEMARLNKDNPDLTQHSRITKPRAVPVEKVDKRPKREPVPSLYQKIVLMGERPESWNKLKRMDRWAWQREVNRCKDLVLQAIPQPNRIEQAVKIVVTAYFDKYPHDASNVPGKLFEDGLVRAGLLADDSMKYVLSMTTQSRIDRERPRVEIELFGENDDLIL